MKQYWQRIVLKIDALSLRERAIIFVMAALLLISLINSVFVDPQFAKQKQVTDRIKNEQAQIINIQTEILQKVNLEVADPDAKNRQHLEELKRQSAQMHESLQDMQKGLVSPDKMAALLESILRQDGKLRLLSLRNFPTIGLNEPVADKIAIEKTVAPASSKNTKTGAESLYKHGVEIKIQGQYADILHYLAALETMPWQLCWEKVKLNVDEYPQATLTLNLFTLSLDDKWLDM